MSIKDTGGHAFPRAAHEGDTTKSGPINGMTLREYYVGQAAVRWSAALNVCDEPGAYARFADHCHRVADALIARGKQ